LLEKKLKNNEESKNQHSRGSKCNELNKSPSDLNALVLSADDNIDKISVRAIIHTDAKKN
jgi:hypothetical protein